MCKELTDQQELFAQTVANNPEMTLTDAYLLAYPKSTGKPQTIWSNASRLRNSPNIVARISEIKAQNGENLAIGKDDLLKVIRSYLFIDIDPKQASKELINAQLKAVEIAMKLCGFEQKQPIDVNFNQKPKIIYHAPDNGRGKHERSSNH